MSIRVWRYEVPVDDQWHELELDGVPMHVTCRDVRVVEFWALHDDDRPAMRRRFMVVGTGQELPVGCEYWDTASAPQGLVWHLIEEIPVNRIGGDG